MSEIKHTELCENLNGNYNGIDCPRCTLYTAAPRLLEACEAAVKHYESSEDMVEAIMQCREAITAAKPK